METENKPMLSIDGEGNILKCAKGAVATDCGYKAGAAVCAKCGAAPVEMKMIPISKNKEMMEDEEMSEDENEVNIYLGEGDEETESSEEMGDEEEIESPEDMDEMKVAYYKQYGWAGYKKKYGKLPYIADQIGEEDGEMMTEEKGMYGMPKKKGMGKRNAPSAMGMMAEMSDEELEASELGADEEMMDEEDEMMDEEKTMMLEDMRKRRIESMGMKASEIGKNGYICAIERKTHPGNAAVCDDCPGGCISEKDSPDCFRLKD